MTDEVKEQVRKFTKQKPIELYPHPIMDNFGPIINQNEARSKLNLVADKKHILFFGFIRAYKGLDLLIEAMKEVDSEIELIVAGEFYADRDKYIDLIERLNLSQRIHLHSDFIPEDQVNLFFNSANLIVQPYKTATQSGVTQIAYHFNKPMVVTDVGGLPEMCPDGKVGYVVPPKATPIAEAVNRFFRENQEKQMIKNVEQEKKRFSWEGLVGSIIRLKNNIY
jgi:glycosyltransferase involved in cell wall biosynthesis